jgi:phospholipase C
MQTYSAPKDFRRASRRLVLLAISLFLISVHAFGGDRDKHDEHKLDSKLRDIKHIVVIYQENWSFDSLYGRFPGAKGLAQASPASLNQTDRFDQPLSGQTGKPFSLISGSLTLTTPPPPINAGKIDTRFTTGLNTLLPYDVLKNSTLQSSDTTGDLVHRYWHEQ